MGEIYASKLKDKGNLLKSSSGGMFAVMAENIIQRGGSVITACYDYEKECLEHKVLNTASDIEKAVGSKYFQSNTEMSFQYLRDLNLSRAKPIMFVGTACQTVAAISFLKAEKLETANVYFVDIICHGVPSPELWSDYAHIIEDKYGKIKYITFKDKRHGWNHPYAYVRTENGLEHSIDEFVKMYYSNCAFRPSCYICPYTSVERITDMTIGDYWGIENILPHFFDNNGVSLVIAHSEKGEQLFYEVQNEIDFTKINDKYSLQSNLIHPTPLPENRQMFWNARQVGILEVVKRYGRMSPITKVKNHLLKKVISKPKNTWSQPSNIAYHSIDSYINNTKNIKHKLPSLCDVLEYCCGCGLCQAICSTNAIFMKMDDEGFLYPYVDAQRCIGCLKCEKVCAIKQDQRNKGYLSST